MSNILDELIAGRPVEEDPVIFVEAARKAIRAVTPQRLDAIHTALQEKLEPDELKASAGVGVLKSATERWDRFSEILDKTGLDTTGPTLLPAGTLESQLVVYSDYVSHVNDCWCQARDSFLSGRFAFSAFFSILTLEETGKLSTLWVELLNHDAPRGPTPTRKDPRYSHKKHFMAACQGALVNARLDRLLGVQLVNEYLAKAESGLLESLRQSCLYTSIGTGGLPRDSVDRDEAKNLCVLSGEVMADVLGNFPWEWKRMSSDVSSFERGVGMVPT